jgi:hypothetical protein
MNATGRRCGFEIDLRHYWRPGTLRLTANRAAGTFRIVGTDGEGPPYSLGQLGSFVETHFTAADAEREVAGDRGRRAREERLARERRSGMRALGDHTGARRWRRDLGALPSALSVRAAQKGRASGAAR